MQDDSCDIIDISSNGKSFDHINKNLLFHDWLGKYYKVGWQNNQSNGKISYRRIEKVWDVDGDWYYVGLSIPEKLGYWGVISSLTIQYNLLYILDIKTFHQHNFKYL